MSEIKKKLQERLRDAKAKCRERASNRVGDTTGRDTNDSATTGLAPSNRVRVSLKGSGREDAATNLRLACTIYLRARTLCYSNYQEKGFAVFDALVDAEPWFRHYCIEPYPDMCCCGMGYIGNHGVVRSHCSVCRGTGRELGYEMQRLSMHTGIHYSWIEYGFAYALKAIADSKLVSGVSGIASKTGEV